MRAIQIDETGDPDVMQWRELPDPEPGAGQVVVDVAAAGLNFIDTYQRTGLYPVPMPYVLGLEGAGVVAAVGDGVGRWSVGDRVAWPGSPGSYATKVALPAERVVAVPASVDLDQAAAIPLQGMTAHYLVTDTFAIGEGSRCLVHAGAGGVGLLLIQMAKLLGAEVFTTVGTAEKAELASAAGADHTILYRDVDFAEAISGIAGPRPLDVVYDGVGKTVFDQSLTLLRPRGMMVTFGNASGPVDPVSPLALSSNGSLFLTRPTLFDYIADRAELERRAADLYDWIGTGRLDVRIGHRFALADAADAHRAIEGRTTTGKVLLVVGD
ncbi:quinone oxidoreductase family protein [Ilumatobacter sp.]|uniref:quinone oxidoreductase family protein n=1 Tax=Ilumatobacter sp. TaxID=1967498 RepID=UPI003AF9984F